jgi:hypothetical protein
LLLLRERRRERKPMNLTSIKTDVAIYHAAKDVAADIKSRNIAALGAGLSTLLAALLPLVQPLGAKYGITLDDATMGYVRSLLLGLAGLCLTRHLKSGPVAVAAGAGAAGDASAGQQGPLAAPMGGRPAVARAPDPVRPVARSSDSAQDDLRGGP